MGANVAAEKGRGNIIDVDPDKCIACGACLDVCEHGAREYIDDVDRFFEDLKRGTRISVLIAPAFLANYPNEYEKYLGLPVPLFFMVNVLLFASDLIVK